MIEQPARASVIARRSLAAVIDRAAIVLLMNIVPLEMAGIRDVLGISHELLAVLIALDVLFTMAYFSFCEGVGAASLGKWIVRLQVTRVTAPRGGSPGVYRAAARAALACAGPVIVSDLAMEALPDPISLAVGVAVWAALSALLFVAPRRGPALDGWHDRLTRTSVIVSAKRSRSDLGVIGAAAAVGSAICQFVATTPSDKALVAALTAVAVLGAILAAVSRKPFAIGVSVCALVVTLPTVGLLTLTHTPHNGNEASAIGSMRAINSAQATYSERCAAGGYAIDLADLVKAPPDSSQGFVSPDLNANGVVKSGYIVTLAKDGASGVTDVGSAGKTCNGSQHQPASGYFASAVPVEPRRRGARFFATDARGTVFFSTNGPVPNPIPPGTYPIQ